MKLVLLFGPPAVGKMAVGHELAQLTGLKLFHNHMTIELVAPFFGFGTSSFRRLVNLFRDEIFKEIAQSDLKGLIFTYVWAFDRPEDREYLDKTFAFFKNAGADIYVVELLADQEERLKRNTSELRLQHKPTKRDTKTSEEYLLKNDREHRLNSQEGEVDFEHYIKIDTTNLTAKQTAERIVVEFGF